MTRTGYIARASYPGREVFVFGTLYPTGDDILAEMTALMLKHLPDGFRIHNIRVGQMSCQEGGIVWDESDRRDD